MTVLQFVEGPMFYIAAVVFILGTLWRVIGIVKIGNKPDLATARGSSFVGGLFTIFRHFVPRRIFARATALHILAGYAFHLGLFLLLVFAAPHIDFIRERILGVGWPALPRWAFIIAAQFGFAGLLILWVRRLSDPVQRLISSRSDYMATGLTFLVMLTGCLALQQAHESLRAIHMAFVDVWLIYFPFSRLMHTFTFFFSRAYTGSSYGRRGVEL